jgi:pimeloyl-ACP methyl ester carboxylesterase
MREEALVDGTLVSWLHEPGDDPPVLYVHGVPDSAELWTPFLRLTGGIAVDLPGFGRSGKAADWPYSLEGYAAFLPAFLDHLGIETLRLVVHDLGAVALTLGERIERLAVITGRRRPWTERMWRTPVVGELAMGFTGRTVLRRLWGLSAEHADQVLRHFDHGTQRAILKLYRSGTPQVPLEAVAAPALVVGERAAAEPIAAALGSEARVEAVPGAGHRPWLDRPEIVQIVAGHLVG